jgi:hypothetical protein
MSVGDVGVRVQWANAARRRLGHRLPAVTRPVRTVLPRIVDTDLLPGIWVRLDLHDAAQADAYWEGPRHQHETAITVRKWVRGAERFFDVGAGFGYFSYVALASDPRVEVHALETEPRYHDGHHRVAHTNELKQRFDPDLVTLDEFDFDRWADERDLTPSKPQAWLAKIDTGGGELQRLERMTDALSQRAFRAVIVAVADDTARAVDAFMIRHRYHHDTTVVAGANRVYLPD